VVDKYVEYDFTLIALDLILQKVGVYRHLLFNRPYLHSDGYWQYGKLFVLILFFSIYLKCCKYHNFVTLKGISKYRLMKLVLALTLDLSSFFTGIVSCLYIFSKKSPSLRQDVVITSILLSYVGRLLLFFFMVWPAYQSQNYIIIIDFLVLMSHVVSLKVVMNSDSSITSVGITLVGYILELLSRFIVSNLDPSLPFYFF